MATIEDQTRQEMEREESLVEQVLDFAARKHGEAELIKAWIAFNDYAGPEDVPEGGIQDDDPLNELFLPWFAFNWGTVASDFLEAQGSTLSDDDVRRMRGLVGRPYSFFRVVEVVPEKGLMLHDLVLESDTQVFDEHLADSMEPGEVLFGSVRPASDGVLATIMMAPFALPGEAAGEVGELVAEIREDSGEKAVTPALLGRYEADLRRLYLDLLDAMDEVQGDA